MKKQVTENDWQCHSSGQLPLPFYQDEDLLKELIERKTGKKVILVLTDNRTVMLSVKRCENFLSVRIQRNLLLAEYGVMSEIAEFARLGANKSMPLFREFLKKNVRVTRRPGRKLNEVVGNVFNLRDSFDRMNRRYFDGKVSCDISWGSRELRRRVRKRTLGSYDPERKRICISRYLDRKTVPQYFLDFVVYHEMLHHVLSPEHFLGRRFFHTKEFRRRERYFESYEKAVAWEKRFFA